MQDFLSSFECQNLMNILKSIGINLIISALIFIVGYLLARSVYKNILKISGFSPESQSLLHYFAIVSRYVIYLSTFTIILSTMGVPSESVIAVLASSGIALGLGLKNHISSVASGLLIQLFRSIKIGDYIKISSYEGRVKKIDLLTTVVETKQGTNLFIPNSKLTSDIIENIDSSNPQEV